MAINKVVNLDENSAAYKSIMREMEKMRDEDLVIVARSEKNRKNDSVKPIEVKNGIYFYVAYDAHNFTAFIPSPTPEKIYIAKANMIRRARLGGMFEIMDGEGTAIDDYTPDEMMNVITLDSKKYGAGLLGCREFIKAISDKFGKCYILPSSIHELIVVPADTTTKNNLLAMVKEINATKVSENEFLADAVYTVNDWILR